MKESKVGQLFDDYKIEERVGLGKSESANLAVYMLYEMKKPDSKFVPFFKLLPANFDDVPTMFSQQELSYLVGTTIFDAISNSRGKLEKLYTNLSNLLPEFPFTL